MVNPGDYFSGERRPLQQGDLVLAPIARLRTDPAPADHPPSSRLAGWRDLDELEIRWPVERLAKGSVPIWTVGGFAVAMLTSHDCHLDKEFLGRYRELREQGHRKDEAVRMAEGDPELDRFANVSPFLPVESVRAAWADIESCRALGLFPVYELADFDLPRGAIDLTHRTTVDRHALTRLASLSDPARDSFRYALARTDALRTPAIGFELEQAIGHRIQRVRGDESNPSKVVLDLSDGSSLELVKPTEEPRRDGVTRTDRSQP